MKATEYGNEQLEDLHSSAGAAVHRGCDLLSFPPGSLQAEGIAALGRLDEFVQGRPHELGTEDIPGPVYAEGRVVRKSFDLLLEVDQA